MRTAALTVLLAALTVAALLTVAAPTTNPAVAPTTTAQHIQAGDDNTDGTIDEDETGWDCRFDGNHQCGVDTPGGPILDQGGVIVGCPTGATLTVTADRYYTCTYTLRYT